jgi:hypothetical protein
MKFRTKCLSLILAVLTLFFAFPITASAAESKEYIKEVRISTAADESTAKQWLTDNGYKVLDFNLNQKSNGEAVYMGYITTTNPDEAITDMAVMQMDGGYSFADYEAMLEEKKEEVNFLLDSISSVIRKGRINYEIGYRAARNAHEVLNLFVEDDSGKKLGDLIFAEECDNETLQKIFLQGNSDIVMIIYNMLAIACVNIRSELGNNNWMAKLERMFGRRNAYAEYDPLLYDDLARKMFSSFEDVHDLIEYYEKECKEIDENPEFTEGLTDEEIADYYPEDYAEAKFIYSTLSEYYYGKISLLEFFAQDVDELDLEELYPLFAAMTVEERAMSLLVGFPAMITMAEQDNESINEYFENFKKEIEYYGFENSISVYTNVDRSLFEGGVALTNQALRESAATGDSSWYSENNIDRELSIALGCLAGASMTTAIATAAISKKVITARYIKNGMASINYDAFYMVLEGLQSRGVSVAVDMTDETMKALKKAVPRDIYLQNRALFDKGDSMVNNMQKTLSKQAYRTQNKSIQRMISTAQTITWIAIGISLIAEAVRIGIKLYNYYYDREYSVIPKIIVSENSDENGSAYINYSVALNQNGEYADLNAWSGERWNALYTTKDRNAGDPILASGLVAKLKDNSMPTTQSYGVHYFGETGACNVSRYLLKKTAPATYIFFTRDHSLRATASTFSRGTLITFASIGVLGGIAIGSLGVIGAGKLKKKKKEESASADTE